MHQAFGFIPLKRILSCPWWGFRPLVALLGAVMVSFPAQAQMLVLKQGESQSLPLLQTRSRVPLQPTEMLHLGMLQERFLEYAVANNWRTLSVNQAQPDWARWQLLPGGESLYPLNGSAVYARGFIVQAYFGKGRLVGMNLVRNARELGFDLGQLKLVIQAWFPDNRLLLRYQVLPDDPSQQVISAYLGEVPPAFLSDLARTDVPFCQTFFSPHSPQSLPPPGSDNPAQCFLPRDINDPRQPNARLSSRLLDWDPFFAPHLGSFGSDDARGSSSANQGSGRE